MLFTQVWHVDVRRPRPLGQLAFAPANVAASRQRVPHGSRRQNVETEGNITRPARCMSTAKRWPLTCVADGPGGPFLGTYAWVGD